jgi:hypothetical protein
LYESVYLGPFFECRNRKADESDMTRGCDSPQCSEHRRPVYDESVCFCARCGRALGEWASDQPTWQFDWSEVSEAVGEKLSLAGRSDDDAEVMRWVPNETRDGEPEGARLEVARGDTTVCTPTDPEAEKRWLSTAFAKEEAVLSGLYGDENVTLNWGLVIWWE